MNLSSTRRVLGIDHPRLRHFIGDVRDLGRLERALADVTGVPAATLKQVPALRERPVPDYSDQHQSRSRPIWKRCRQQQRDSRIPGAAQAGPDRGY